MCSVEVKYVGKRLDIELYRYNRLVFGRVVHQDDDLISATEDKVLARDGGYQIASAVTPALTGNTLYVRGRNKRKDNNVFTYMYASEEQAIEATEKIKMLVDTINSVGDEVITKVVKII